MPQTLYRNRVLWALPLNPTNLEIQRRLGVGVYSAGNPDHTPFAAYTNPQRLAIVNGTATYGTAANQIGNNDPNLLNFVVPWALAASPTVQSFYIGSASFTDVEWSRLQARIPTVTGLHYFKASLDANDNWVGDETSEIILTHWIGQICPAEDGTLFNEAGLVQWDSGLGDGG